MVVLSRNFCCLSFTSPGFHKKSFLPVLRALAIRSPSFAFKPQKGRRHESSHLRPRSPCISHSARSADAKFIIQFSDACGIGSICRRLQSPLPSPRIPPCLNSSCSTGTASFHSLPELSSGLYYFFHSGYSNPRPLFFR